MPRTLGNPPGEGRGGDRGHLDVGVPPHPDVGRGHPDVGVPPCRGHSGTPEGRGGDWGHPDMGVPPTRTPASPLSPVLGVPHHVQRLAEELLQVEAHPVAGPAPLGGHREDRGQQVLHLRGR